MRRGGGGGVGFRIQEKVGSTSTIEVSSSEETVPPIFLEIKARTKYRSVYSPFVKGIITNMKMWYSQHIGR